MGSSTDFQLPVIDLSDENLQLGTEKWLSTCQMVKNALESYSCFYVMSKKIPMQLHNSIFTLMKQVFDLPLETKQQCSSDYGMYGYIESAPKRPLYESWVIDHPSIKEAWEKFTKLMWPNGYDQFSETFNLYGKLLVELNQTIIRMVFDSYGVDKRQCDNLVLDPTNFSMRGVEYSVAKKKISDESSNMGLETHSDSCFTTILQQNNEDGLQVQLKNGEWLEIDSSPHMLLFMASDTMQVWSNDRIKACKHKVIIKGKKDRYSLGLFAFNNHVDQPQEEFVDEEHPIQYKSFHYHEFIRFLATSKAKCGVKAYCGIDYVDDSV